MTLIDTNILVDILTSDPVWLRWSADQLDQRADIGSMFTNEIIFNAMYSPYIDAAISTYYLY